MWRRAYDTTDGFAVLSLLIILGDSVFSFEKTDFGASRRVRDAEMSVCSPGRLLLVIQFRHLAKLILWPARARDGDGMDAGSDFRLEGEIRADRGRRWPPDAVTAVIR